ncbi:transcription antitermination factor NusB [Metabacillus idriensis]|uniref:transcription antitermination factor NusB n=1 Tax=Metabacillus idriensis TaxID=324768 RepID=UPI003D2DA9CE
MKRRLAREKALQALFQIDVSDIDPKEAMSHALDGEDLDEFMTALVLGTIEHMAEIDEQIKPHLVKWKLERLANVDRSVLRLAVYEMMYIEEIPVNVTLDEAIELAKTFGDDQSPKFINGVLSNIKQTIDK